MDDEGYPTEEELNKVRTWPVEDRLGLFAFLKDICIDCAHHAHKHSR